MEKQNIRKSSKKAKPKIFSKEEWYKKFFGKLKIFGDGVAYQRKLRDE